jgi:hypothetical protein
MRLPVCVDSRPNLLSGLPRRKRLAKVTSSCGYVTVALADCDARASLTAAAASCSSAYTSVEGNNRRGEYSVVCNDRP